jgi:hypothetical protein
MGNRPAMEVIKWNESQRKLLNLPEHKYGKTADARLHQCRSDLYTPRTPAIKSIELAD